MPVQIMAARSGRTLCLECLHELDRERDFDKNGLCDHCDNRLDASFTVMPCNYYPRALRTLLYKEVAKRHGTEYVSMALITVHGPHIPLSFMLSYMEEVSEAGRREDSPPWDQEGPRTMWKVFSDSKAWLLSTWGAVQFLCSWEELDASVVPRGEKALGNMRQTPEGDCIFLVPPVEVSWSSSSSDPDEGLFSVTIKASTTLVSAHSNTSLQFTPLHPSDTSDEGANISRWRHLPLYNDYILYLSWKSKEFLNKSHVRRHLKKESKGILLAAISEPTWVAADLTPEVVQSRIPGADFKVTTVCALPYQHPKLTQTSSGSVTLQMQRADHARKEAAKEKVKERERKELEAYQAWERDAYAYGKALTARVNGTEERRAYNFKTRGYRMEEDPRFNGEHEKANYDGVGPDPCDNLNRRLWIKNYPHDPPGKRIDKRARRG